MKELFAKVDRIRQNSVCIRRQSRQLARAGEFSSTLNIYTFLSVESYLCQRPAVEDNADAADDDDGEDNREEPAQSTDRSSSPCDDVMWHV